MRSINILQLNTQSINNKIDILEYFFNQNNIDVALIQETWTKKNQKIKMKSYNVLLNSREDSRGGGVAIFIRKRYPYYPSQILQNQKLEVLEVKTKIEDSFYTFVSFYNPNQQNINTTKQEFQTLINNHHLTDKIIIGGDINGTSFLWSNNPSEDALGKGISDIIMSSSLSVINNGDDTRMNLFNNTSSAIDITLASQDLIPFINWHIINDTIGSDHKPILIQIQNSLTLPEQKTITDQNAIIEDINNLSIDHFSNLGLWTGEIQNIIYTNSKRINIDPRKTPKIWWNDHIGRLWSIKKEKLLIYNRTKNLHTAIELKKAVNRLKLEIRKAKNESWKTITSEMHEKSTGEMWKLFKSIKKTGNNNQILKDKDSAENFLKKNFPESIETEQLPCNVLPTDQLEDFSFTEYNGIIEKAKVTSPGIDKINYKILKSINYEASTNFLSLLNKIWKDGRYPTQWKIANVIGIPKPQTDSSNIDNLRPISLLPVPSKILDKMILGKMSKFAEENRIIPMNSFGFQRGKSINDLFVQLLEKIEMSKKSREKCVILKLDIKKAFDNVDKSVLIDILKRNNFSPYYINWIYGFLTNRTVQIGNVYKHITNKGLPQGSPLSPFLFVIYTAVLHNVSNENTHIFQFADDLIILNTAHTNEVLRQNSNIVLNRLTTTLNDLKLSFSTEKCEYMRLFPNFDPNFIISIGNIIIKETQVAKILGILVTNRLSLTPHYNNIKQNAYKNLNLLKTLAFHHEGLHPKNCLNVYKATTKATINFAQVITDNKKKNLNKIIQTVENQSLRVCTGVTRSTPIVALLAESGEMPSNLNNLYYTMRYMASQIHKRNPLGERIFAKTSLYKFNEVMDNYQFMSYIAPKQIVQNHLPPNLTIKPSLLNIKKNVTSNTEILTIFNEIISNYDDWTKIYTDASKSLLGQGIGIYIKNVNHQILESSIRIEQDLSIKTLEAIAVKEAILIAQENQWSKVIVLTDSKSTCLALNHKVIDESKFYENSIVNLVKDTQCEYHIQWIPGHSTIFGNDRADFLAKKATECPNTETIGQVIPLKDAYTLIKKTVYKEWENTYALSPKGLFNITVNNKSPPPNPWIKRTTLNSKDSRIIIRMRTGHTFDKKFKTLIKIDNDDKCSTCNTTEDFIHLINHCIKYNNIRNKYSALKKPVDQILKQMNETEIMQVLKFYKEAKLEF